MKRFKIKKSKHYSSWWFFNFRITFKNKIAFRVILDDSCIYDLKNEDNYDVNKLFGFSCSYSHHIQSARIGWRRKDHKSFEILAYTYDNGIRLEPKLIGIVEPNKIFTCTIEETDNVYRYTLYTDDTFSSVYVEKKHKKPKFRYILWPYFGGNQPAPHDMVIYLKRIK